MRCFASATAFLSAFGFEMVYSSSFSLVYRMNSLCERPCRRAPALAHSQCAAASRRSRRDFKEQRAFPMAEERWSVAVAKVYSTPSGESCKPEIK